MSTALHLAKPTDFERVDALVSQFHQEFGLDISDSHRAGAIQPLLDGVPHGMIYLLGLPRAPVGYIVVSLGWSIELGGLDGFVDEFFVRPSVRGRGIATEVLHELSHALGAAGVKALHLEVDAEADNAQRLYKRAGFEPRERNSLMSRYL